jgi:hypothetical protein
VPEGAKVGYIRLLEGGTVRIVKGILVGLAIFTVSTMSYGLIRGTIEFYRLVQAVKVGATTKDAVMPWYFGGLIHNLYLWLALCASVAVGIWIMKRHGISNATMRLLISAFIGFASVALLMTAGILCFSSTSPAISSLDTALVSLLYWPARLLVVGRLDCPNADSIAEKMTCAAMCLGISCLAYSAVAYVLLSLVQKWRRPPERRLIVRCSTTVGGLPGFQLDRLPLIVAKSR